jgi:hypothetical protein
MWFPSRAQLGRPAPNNSSRLLKRRSCWVGEKRRNRCPRHSKPRREIRRRPASTTAPFRPFFTSAPPAPSRPSQSRTGLFLARQAPVSCFADRCSFVAAIQECHSQPPPILSWPSPLPNAPDPDKHIPTVPDPTEFRGLPSEYLWRVRPLNGNTPSMLLKRPATRLRVSGGERLYCYHGSAQGLGTDGAEALPQTPSPVGPDGHHEE